MPSVGPTELVIILVILLLVFGAGKLSGVGEALGKSIREFRRASADDEAQKPQATEGPGAAPKP